MGETVDWASPGCAACVVLKACFKVRCLQELSVWLTGKPPRTARACYEIAPANKLPLSVSDQCRLVVLIEAPE